MSPKPPMPSRPAALGNHAARAGMVLATLLAMASCRPPDPTALQKLACEQAAANLDLQSVSQMDALRKALGAPMDAAPEAAEQTESQP